MKKLYCSAVNRKIHENTPEFVSNGEKAYAEQIRKTADEIAQGLKEKPIILLAGPSGAGKTTTALRLEDYLDLKGTETHTISMDDYFLPADSPQNALNEQGEIDYESPYRLDISLLNQHMAKIAGCEEVEIPKFDFTEQKRREGRIFKRKKGEVVIFEGIHALNPLVTGMTDSFANFMYVSVRTRVVTAGGGVLHPSYIRLMRRLIRDKLYRARSAEETIKMFASVENGARKYIMPFKNRADYAIDTFLPYELSVYKKFLVESLEEVKGKIEGFDGIDLLLEALYELDDVEVSNVPQDSLVREFIGGSRFEY